MSGTHAPARLVMAGVCAVALVACGGSSGSSSSSSATSSSSSTSSASTSAGGAAATITIKSFAFTTPASVSPGATITVDNMDGVAHTVTSDGKSFDDAASPGTSTFTAPTSPGSYPFHCNIHPEMHGTLVVK